MTLEERIQRIERKLGLTDSDVITDRDTELMWDAKGSLESMNWHEACKYANDCRVGGYTDWRLPSLDELQTILDRSKYQPALKTLPGLTCKSSSYWTATTSASSTILAWCVGFFDGSVGWGGKATDKYYIRCVRDNKI